MRDRAEKIKDAPPQILADTPANASETAAINLSRIKNLCQTFVQTIATVDKTVQHNQ